MGELSLREGFKLTRRYVHALIRHKRPFASPKENLANFYLLYGLEAYFEFVKASHLGLLCAATISWSSVIQLIAH